MRTCNFEEEPHRKQCNWITGYWMWTSKDRIYNIFHTLKETMTTFICLIIIDFIKIHVQILWFALSCISEKGPWFKLESSEFQEFGGLSFASFVWPFLVASSIITGTEERKGIIVRALWKLWLFKHSWCQVSYFLKPRLLAFSVATAPRLPIWQWKTSSELSRDGFTTPNLDWNSDASRDMSLSTFSTNKK